MKLFLVSLLVAGFSHWAGDAVACPKHDGAKVKSHVVKVVDEDGNVSAPCVVAGKARVGKIEKIVAPCGSAGITKVSAPNAFVFATGPDDGRSDRKRYVVRKKGDGKAPGWLGVSIANVPDALAAQLEIEGKAVIIQNVVDDSPADEAGVQVHDILLSIDGDTVEGDVNRAVELVKIRAPGDKVKLHLLRDGDDEKIVVRLGSRATLEADKLEWKFETAPDAEVEDRVRARGKMMWRSDDGEWVMKDLGDLDKLKELPESIKMFVPKAGDRSVQIFKDGGVHRVRTKVKSDGGVIVIEQDGDEVSVSRVDEHGDEVEMTYENMDELLEADEEAYGLLKDSTSTMVHIDVDGIGEILTDIDFDDLDIELPEFKFDFKFDADELKEHVEDWQAHLEESLGAAKDAHEHAMDEFHVLLEEWNEKKDSGELKKALPHFIWKGKGGPGLNTFKIGKPKHSFEVRTDGTIEVRIRKGDSELVQLFEDARDLRRRNPDLHETYEDLMEVEEDE